MKKTMIALLFALPVLWVFSETPGVDGEMTHTLSRKVSSTVTTAGAPPTGTAGGDLTGHEYNNYVDAGSATYFCANCPVPIEFTGFTQSGLVIVGSSVAATIPKTSPIRRAYDIFFAEYGGTTREAWDQLSILHAVRGLGSYWTRSAAGTNVVDGSGNNTFTVGAGQHYYLTNLMSANGLASVIEALQTQAPSGGFH